MSQQRDDIEAFVRNLVVLVETAEGDGIAAPEAIADYFNARGITTRKGRQWTGATVAKFLSSPGAKRYRAAQLDQAQLRHISATTIGHYDRLAEDYRGGTLHHDVSQNYAAFLGALEGEPPYVVLDLGCGPGRDLRHFHSLGYEAVGLDGSAEFATMARRYSGCEVLHQDFLAMSLPSGRFDGVFANASLFHVPSQELPGVLGELSHTMKPRGVLFCSNPHGNNEENFSGDRYACFYNLETWRGHLSAAGYMEISHYYRPSGQPRHLQPWLASVWRKG
jgi:SAM-dependent methyltransferase